MKGLGLSRTRRAVVVIMTVLACQTCANAYSAVPVSAKTLLGPMSSVARRGRVAETPRLQRFLQRLALHVGDTGGTGLPGLHMLEVSSNAQIGTLYVDELAGRAGPLCLIAVAIPTGTVATCVKHRPTQPAGIMYLMFHDAHGEIVLIGLAANNVRSVAIAANGRTVRPKIVNNAFVATLANASSPMALVCTYTDGRKAVKRFRSSYA